MSARDWGLASAAIALFADQASKLVLLYGFGLMSVMSGARILTTPVLDLVMAWNSGVSFSFFSAHSHAGIALLAAVETVGICALALWLWRTQRPALSVGLGLVIGGALGNLVDRLVYGRVADFFDLHLFGRDFFACNLADVAISLGVLLLLLDAATEPGKSAGRLQRETE